MNDSISLILSMIPEFLRVVAAAAQTTSLGPVIDTVLGTGANLIEAGEAGVAEFGALTSHIKAMVAAGTDPTPSDWDALQARSEAAHALIQKGSTA